jgi:hypothetical protein
MAPRTASRTSRSATNPPRRHVRGERQQPARARFNCTIRARTDGDDSLVERFDDRVEQRVLRLERGEPRGELLRHAMQREREVAHFARRRQRRSPIELAGGDRPRNVAELDDRPRDAARKPEPDDQRADQRDQSR